jgi:hypothetical protein
MNPTPYARSSCLQTISLRAPVSGGHAMRLYIGSSVRCTVCGKLGPCGERAPPSMPATHECALCGACDRCCAKGSACSRSGVGAAGAVSASPSDSVSAAAALVREWACWGAGDACLLQSFRFGARPGLGWGCW